MNSQKTYEQLLNENNRLEEQVSALKNAEKAFQKSEERYRLLFENMTTGFALHEIIENDKGEPVDYRFLEINPAFTKLTGLSADTLLGKTVLEVLPETEDYWIKTYGKVAQTEKPIAYENYAKELDKYYDVWAFSPQRGQFAVIFNDITARKVAQKALLESEHILKEAQEIGKIGHWNLDIVNNELKWSDEIYRIFDIKPQEFQATYEAFLNNIHPDDREAVNEAYTNSLKNKTSYSIDHRLKLKNGKIKYVREQCRNEYDKDGNPLRSIGTVLDITEQQLAELHIIESEKKYRRLVEGLSEEHFFYTHDTDGVFTYLSPSIKNVLGYTQEEFLIHYSEYLTDNPINQEAEKHSMLSMQGIQQPLYEVEIYHEDQSIKTLEVIETPIRDDDNRVIGVEGIAHDITPRKIIEKDKKKLEENLRQAEKLQAIGQLAGGIAHDFNNQLAGIYSCAERLKNKLSNDQSLSRYTDNILTAAKRSADLTRQLLAFARKGNYVSVWIDIHNTIDEVVGLLNRSIDKRIEIKQQLNAHPSCIMGDPTQIQNAILNLAINARDAMPQGGELFFSTSNVELDQNYCDQNAYEITPGKYINICITDTGIGIDKETKSHIFEPFFTTKELGKGTGMGLAAVYGTLKNHNGTINVHSELGHGTTMSLYIPQAGPENKSISEKKEDEKFIQGTGTILVVDDEDVLRETITDILASLGYNVHACPTSQEALEIYRKNWKQIDLALLDMILPDMGGKELFLAMKKVNPDINAIISSGYSIDSEAQEIIENGAKAFIQKPFKIADLSKIIDEVLNKT